MRSAACLFLSLLTIAPIARAHAWRTGGPDAGEVRAIVRAASDADVLYVAADDGIYKSMDNGASWRAIADPDAIALLAVDPRDANVVYAVRVGDEPAPHVFRTLDGGLHWEPVVHGLPTGSAFVPPLRPAGIVIDPGNPDVIYLASACRDDGWCVSGGLFRSSDQGSHWSRVDGVPWPVELTIDPEEPHTIYVTDMLRGRIRSDDGGGSWESDGSLLPSRVVRSDPFDPSRRYGIGDVSLLLTSDDGGDTWKGDVARVLFTDGTVGSFSGVLEIDRQTGRLFIGSASSGLFRSGDRGQSWLPIGGTAREPIWQMLFDERTATLIIGTPTGVYTSSGFPWENWTPLAIGNRTLDARSLAGDPTRPETLYSLSYGRLFVTHDGGHSWNPAPIPPPLLLNAEQVVAGAGGDLYLRVHPNAVLRLTAGAEEWELSSLPLNPRLLVADPTTRGRLYAAGNGGLVVSEDSGSTWRHAAPGNPHALAFDPRDADRLILAAGSEVLVSVDRAVTWTSIVSDFGADGIAISPSDPNVVTALGRRYGKDVVARSLDGGATWIFEPIASEVRGPYGEITLIADRFHHNTLYLRSGSGVHRTTDGGLTWSSLTSGLPPQYYYSMTLDPTGRTLHAGTSLGVWSLGVAVRTRSVRRF
ncbi:MAG TPA: hypothetical protein VF701_19805 [Thermoanaerobaculia bacterium]